MILIAGFWAQGDRAKVKVYRSQRGGVDKGSSPLKPKISAVPSLRNRRSFITHSFIMADTDQQLEDVRKKIQEAYLSTRLVPRATRMEATTQLQATVPGVGSTTLP